MPWIALKMLLGDWVKYLGSIAGITIAALLIAQQSSIFCGLMLRTTSHLRDVADADVWVMDPGVQYFEELRPIRENCLYQVRSVPGVAWAVPFSKAQGRMKLLDGHFQQVIVLGLDDASLTGAPQRLLLGSLDDLRRPDAVIMDEAGYQYLWPNEPLRLGRTFELNDHTAVLVGVCKASRTFQTFPILYTRYQQARTYTATERRTLPFVLVKGEPGLPLSELCGRIRQRTGLQALSHADFSWQTISYYLRRTSIPQNFAVTVILGFIVGCATAGQTFYTFVRENSNQYSVLKAMGAGNGRIVGMVLIQALAVGATGYCLGFGLACLFGVFVQNTQMAFFMIWQVPAITAAAVAMIMTLASLFSIHNVLRSKTMAILQV